MESRQAPKFLLLLMFVLMAALISCNMPGYVDEGTPTQNVTQAYQTVNAKLTHAAETNPAGLLTPTQTDSGIIPASPTGNPQQTPSPPSITTPASTLTPSPICDQATAGNPIDVTVPDDTVMSPGVAFTKIWRIKNIGSCTWTTAYSVAHFSGEQMSAPAKVFLANQVPPGESIDIAVDMRAPGSPGKYQSNWKMSNPGNTLFGIGPNGSSPFWVRVEVVATPTPSPTAPTPTTTPTASTTPPVVQAQGSANITPGDKLDLDSLQINTGESDDISYETNLDGQRLLMPLGAMRIGRFGNDLPSFEDCRAAELDASPLPVDEMPTSVYWCYRTNQGLPGYLNVTNFNVDNYNLTLNITTWSIP